MGGCHGRLGSRRGLGSHGHSRLLIIVRSGLWPRRRGTNKRSQRASPLQSGLAIRPPPVLQSGLIRAATQGP
ncbi:hypothetical protein BF49_6192 [Bradyrhizobium sp.]|nr:hypothetical protein BF49_6192 [Bradyrhizobium sp.]